MAAWFEMSVRGYEIGDDATVSPAQITRYFEAVRWTGIHDGDEAMRSMFENGHRMVVRAQQLQVLETIGMWTEMRVSLSLGRIGRASVDMHQTVVEKNSGKLLARGIVTAVHLDESWRPVPVPQSARKLLEPDDFSELLPTLSKKIETPPGAWQRSIEVRPSDLDVFRHVNHANYIDYATDTVRLAMADGVYGDMVGDKLSIEALSVDYRDQAVLGDELRMVTWAWERGVIALHLFKNDEPHPICAVRLNVKV